MKKLLFKQKWLLTMATLFLWSTVASMADAGLPTKVTITPGTGIDKATSDGWGSDSPYTKELTSITAGQSVTFVARPDATSLSSVGNYAANYQFKLTGTGNWANYPILPGTGTGVTYTPGTASTWSHSLTFTTDFEVAGEATYTLSYEPIIAAANITFTNGTGVAGNGSSPALATAPWIAGGGFQFTATPTSPLTAELIGQYQYKWKVVVQDNSDTSPADFADLAAAGITVNLPNNGVVQNMNAANFSIGLDYNTLKTAGASQAAVTKLKITVSIVADALGATLSGSDATGLTAFDPATKIATPDATTAGKYSFDVDLSANPAVTSEVDDTKELTFKNGSDAVIPVYATGTTPASSVAPYITYDLTGNNKYKVTVWNAATVVSDATLPTPYTVTVSYTDKPSVTVQAGTETGNVITTPNTTGTAFKATKGKITVPVTVSSGANQGLWVFTSDGSTGVLNATSTPVKAEGSTFTGNNATVTFTKADGTNTDWSTNLSAPTVAYIVTTNAHVSAGNFSTVAGLDKPSVTDVPTTVGYVNEQPFTIKGVKIAGFIKDNPGNPAAAQMAATYHWVAKFYNGEPAPAGTPTNGLTAPTSVVATETSEGSGVYNVVVTSAPEADDVTNDAGLYVVLSYELDGKTAVPVKVDKAANSPVNFNLTNAEGFAILTSNAGSYTAKATVNNITGFNNSNYTWTYAPEEDGTGTAFTDATNPKVTAALAGTAANVLNITVEFTATYSGVTPVEVYATLKEKYSPTAAVAQLTTTLTALNAAKFGIKNFTQPVGNSTNAGKFTFDATIDDELAIGGTFKIYKYTAAAGETPAKEEEIESSATNPSASAVEKDGSNGRTYTVTIDYGNTTGALDVRVAYTSGTLAKAATFNVKATTTDDLIGASHKIEINPAEGTINDGKFYFLITPTVPRPKNSTGAEYTLAFTTTDKVGTAAITIDGTTGVATSGSALDGRTIDIHKSAPKNDGVDTIVISNVTFKQLSVKVRYQSPDLKVTVVPRATNVVGGNDLIASVTPNTEVTLSDGEGVFYRDNLPANKGFDVLLDAAKLVDYKGTTKFSFVFEVGTPVAAPTAWTAISEPVATYAQKKNSDGTLVANTYTVNVTGLKYTKTRITVAYDTIPAKAVEAETKPLFTAVEDNQVEAALNAADEGEIIPVKKPNADLGAEPTELETFENNGTIVPGEKLAAVITVTEPNVINNTPKTVVLTFSGALSILPPLTVENVWITKPSFKIVYVFDSSTATLRNAVQTRAADDTWTEYDAVNEILYVHLVDIDVTVLGGDPSYAQLAIKEGEKVTATVGASFTAVTLYDNPYTLIPDNGVPGTNYPGYFTLDGNYPTDGQLRYKVGNDEAFKPYYDGITYQEIERLANGEYLYFGLAIDSDKAKTGEAGVPNALFIYVPKTYATTGDNPVVVPRPYAIVAATTNTVALGFSRTAGSTTTGEFNFKVTPATVLQNGELTATFSKKGGGTVNPLPVFVPGLPDIDGAYNAKVTNIKVSDIVITVEYKQGVAVEEVSTSKVWSYGKTVFISSTSNGIAKIYSLSGQLVKTVNVNTGTTITELPNGIYLVNTADGKISKIVVE